MTGTNLHKIDHGDEWAQYAYLGRTFMYVGVGQVGCYLDPHGFYIGYDVPAAVEYLQKYVREQSPVPPGPLPRERVVAL